MCMLADADVYSHVLYKLWLIVYALSLSMCRRFLPPRDYGPSSSSIQAFSGFVHTSHFQKMAVYHKRPHKRVDLAGQWIRSLGQSTKIGRPKSFPGRFCHGCAIKWYVDECQWVSFVQSVRTIATCDHHVDQHNQYVGQLCCSSTAQVLSKITLDLRAGKTTAVVGKSGCGKSTLSASATLWSTYVDMRCTEKSQRLEIKKKTTGNSRNEDKNEEKYRNERSYRNLRLLSLL